MAQRRSKNRRSSRLLTNFLDDNTNVADSSNNPTWYRYSSVRPSTSINLTKRNSTLLNTDSDVDLTQQSDWFKNLSHSDSFKRKLGAMSHPPGKSTNHDLSRKETTESSIVSESDEERPKKKPRSKFLRRNTAKKNRESNRFLKALDDTKNSSMQSVAKEISVQNTSKSSNDDSRTNRKLRPTIFKITRTKSAKKNEENNFDKDLDSDLASDPPSTSQSFASENVSAQNQKDATVSNRSLTPAQRETYGILKEPLVRLKSVTPTKSVANSLEISRDERDRRSSRSRTALFPIENQDISNKSLGDNTIHSVKNTLAEKSHHKSLVTSLIDATFVEPKKVPRTSRSSSTSYRSISGLKKNLTSSIVVDTQELVETPVKSRIITSNSKVSLRNSSKVYVAPIPKDSTPIGESSAITRPQETSPNFETNSVDVEISRTNLTKDNQESDHQAQASSKSHTDRLSLAEETPESFERNARQSLANLRSPTQRISVGKSAVIEGGGTIAENESAPETHLPTLNQKKNQEKTADPPNVGDVEEELNKLMQSPEHSGSVNGLLNDLMDSPGGPAQSTMVISGKPVNRVTQFSFRTGSDSGKSNTATPSKAAPGPQLAQSMQEKLLPPVTPEPVQLDHDDGDDDSSWSDNPLIHKSDVDIPQAISEERVVNRNKIDRFLVSKPMATSAIDKQKSTSDDLLTKLKARSQELMRKEDAERKRKAEKEREIAQQKSIANATFGRREAARLPKKSQNPKHIHSAYLVNGQRYQPPRLPRPQNWVTDRLYKHLWRKMEPKFGLRTRVKSENFVTQLSASVKLIAKRKKFENYKSELNRLIRRMAELDIIVTREDFHNFCREFMPYYFRKKVIPMNIPGKGLNIPSDPLTLDRPIIRKHERRNSENSSEDEINED
ncbi:hypothetical protein QAD02_014550 [Eretmocerus hayati]|uniref:Uncharacterized protein n=1 Tax=Eretmocerus hayati TaxID=131215 RepID=A0ACC2P6M1_9HYME|nr:hypothetical protein QAD02_014550 [Eretmocerus hayati]